MATERRVKVLEAVGVEGKGKIQITMTRGRKSQVDVYNLQVFRAYDHQTGVALTKEDGTTTYHICLSDKPTCDCKGETRWQRSTCKHIGALAKLKELGLLPLPVAEKVEA